MSVQLSIVEQDRLELSLVCIASAIDIFRLSSPSSVVESDCSEVSRYEEVRDS